MMTGTEYRASLDDGRATFFEGRRIPKIAEDPVLGIAVDTVADGYDRYYDPASDAVGAAVKVPDSAEGLHEQAKQFESLDPVVHLTQSSLMTVMTAADRIQSDLPDNAARMRAYVEDVQRNDLRVTQCITDAKGDRSLSASKQHDPDAYVRVVDRRNDGIVIRGAKLHITGASLGHELLTIPTKTMKAGEDDYSVACAVPVNAPGVKVINTTTFPRHPDTRHFPISGRTHMPEGFVIFEDVFVPHERVFLDGSPEHSAVFAHSLGLWIRLAGLIDMTINYDRLVGYAQLIAEANGLMRTSHIKDKIAEMVVNATLVHATLEAAIANCNITSDGAAFPDELFTNVGKYHAAANHSLMVRNLHDIAGGSVLTAPTIADFENEEIGHLVRKYMGTRQEIDGLYRAKLFHAIRDNTADAYGGWVEVTNIQSGAGLYAQRVVARAHYDLERAKRMALEHANMMEYAEVALG